MTPLCFDIVCRIVDNLGDAGVCWRLARQLAAEHRIEVRLWIDDLATLARIVPGLDPASKQQRVAAVDIRALDDVAPLASLPDAMIAGFGCALPQRWLDAFAQALSPPVYVNLEYLSAEAWVDDAHGLPSPHPVLPLQRWFYFPGFTQRTGGLLRERGLIAARDAFQRDEHRIAETRRSLGAPASDALVISLFCYPNCALDALLDVWSHDASPVHVAVPANVASDDLARWTRDRAPNAGNAIARGALTLSVVPFTDQDGFDRRLWSCDLDMVRGEDSFVRAQWAARPLIWHAYPQVEDARVAKVDAFLARYLRDADPAAGAALAEFTRAFNAEDGPRCARAWPPLRAALPALRRHAQAWAEQIGGDADLAVRLVQFVQERL